MNINPFKTIKYQLYLFQLENYDIKRFWDLMLKSPAPKHQPRKKLIWTAKLILITALAKIFALSIAFSLAWNVRSLIFQTIVFFGVFYVETLYFYVFLIIADTVIFPIDRLVKIAIISRARNKISQFQNLKVIGITGSYGKTTMKEALRQVLGVKYKVLATSDSVNTPVGISRLIVKELARDTEILIVEMGAYSRGDIQSLCEIAPPDIAILTGINEAHLERFGSLENTISAKFELVENAKSQALVVLNGDSKLVSKHYRQHLRGRRARLYSIHNPTSAGQLQLLGEYALGIVNAVVIVASELGLGESEISAGVGKITPIPHRLQPIWNKAANILVIDDSYSGNPEGVREAIKVLQGYKDKRKIYITPGLVEMGDRSREVHLEIGRQLSKTADLVILIKNSVTPWIAEGIKSTPSPGAGERWRDVAGAVFQTPSLVAAHTLGRQKLIVWFPSTQEAHDALRHILKSGDVILFQNDWTENYI